MTTVGRCPPCEGHRPTNMRVSDGTLKRDIPHHKAALYQLSYTHHAERPPVMGGRVFDGAHRT